MQDRFYADRFNRIFDLDFGYEVPNKERHDRCVDERRTKTLWFLIERVGRLAAEDKIL